MALVEANRYYNSLEAGLAQSRLAADGIQSFLFDLEMNWGWSDGLIMIRLMVDDEDLDAARRLLSDRSDEAPAA